MNITLTPECLASLEAEAARRNAVPDAVPTTAEEIATVLLSKAADSYARTAQEAYARSLYERIAASDPATQKAIFTAAEQALS